MSKCYHCGRPGVTRHRTSYYCPHCDTRFYAATGTVPYCTPYYVILDRWFSSGSRFASRQQQQQQQQNI